MYKCVLSAPEMISECFSLQHNIHTPAAGEQGHIQPGGQMSADTWRPFSKLQPLLC